MYIKRLELKGYGRLSLNNIELFIYTPESIYQLILGTNGSGKSSVLAELSPLPAHKSNYKKDGYKLIHLEHRGGEYVLKSCFATNRHSFLFNSEELNPGGTGEVQKELVEHHFNYTKDVHELLTGQTLFTRMTLSDRRKWVSRLSTQDYSYAIGVHRKLASAARDQLGAAKHLKSRLSQEHANLTALGTVTGLSVRAGELRSELNDLLMARDPSAGQLEPIMHQLERFRTELLQCSNQVVRGVDDFRTRFGAAQPEDVLEWEIATAAEEIAAIRARVLRMSEEHMELERSIQKLCTSDGVTPQNVAERIEEARQALSAHPPVESEFGPLTNAEALLDTFQRVRGALTSLMQQLPDNSDRRFSRESIELKARSHNEMVDRVTWLNRELTDVNHQLNHILNASSTECPQCNHRWVAGVAPGRKEALMAKRDQMAAELASLEPQVAHGNRFLNEAQAVSQLYRSFNGMMENAPSLSPLWDYLGRNGLVTGAPEKRSAALHRFEQALRAQIAYDAANRHYERLVALQTEWQSAEDGNLIRTRMADISRAVDELSAHLRVAQQDHTQRQAKLRALRELSDLSRRTEKAAASIGESYNSAITAIRNRHIDDITNRHQNELAALMRRLTEHQTLAGIVNDLETSHDSVAEAQADLALLADALSPTEGLVAEQLCGFIQCLVDQLNSIIGQIWTYDLTVMPCGMESGELNYKFPVSTPLQHKPSPDVSKVSKGQEQAINMAFQLTAMLYLGYQSYPLFLDEPGEGFDEQHRNNLMPFVKMLVDSGQYSQLFMISHYASNHGMFTQADVTVLDASNIAVAGKVNNCAVFG